MNENFLTLQVTRILLALHTGLVFVAFVFLTGLGMVDPLSVIAIVAVLVAWAVLFPAMYRAALREQYDKIDSPNADKTEYTRVLSIRVRRRERKHLKAAGTKAPSTGVRADVLALAGWTVMVFVLLSYAQAMLAATLDLVG